MKPEDRSGGPPPKAPPPKKAKSAGRGGSARRASARKTKPKQRGGATGLGRLIRRTLYWSVVAGIILFAGLAGVVGYYWSKLPPTAEWSLPARPVNVRIVASNGDLITNRGDTAGATLTLDEMSPYLPEAVVAIEDRRFYWHFGIDPIGLVRAAIANFRSSGVVQGGSTITQQLAKNLFLKPERTFERKIQEAILAVWLEANLSKKQILELYLNRVYLGAGAYGVDAAAHRYFGKSARNLTIAEAATIAGLLKAPGHYSPLVDPDAAEGRAQVVIKAMREAGYLSDRDASLALSAPIQPVHDVAGGSGRYVADWVMNILPSYVGSLDKDIIVDTTIDLRMQAIAARAVSDTLAEDGQKFGVGQGAFVAMDQTGAVKALIGGRDYAASPFNRVVDAHRQPGSAFKPFVYLTALEHGLAPETVRIDQPVTIKGWRPENYTHKYLGPVTLQTGLALSLNTISAQLTAEVGPSAVAATARRLGITSPLTATPSIALGTSEVSLLELTGAYVPFSNGGMGIIPHVIERIRTADGKVLYQRSGDGTGLVVDPTYVAMMNSMMADTLARGTGRKAAIANWPAAGKTGTSQDFRDAWFVGYTAILTAGAWFGNDNSTPTKKASGSNLPSIAWQRFMSAALAGTPVADLPGHYRFGDPANLASGDYGPIGQLAAQRSVTLEDGSVVPASSLSRPDPVRTDSIGALAADPDMAIDQPAPDGPVPPADVGGGDAGSPKKKGFFRRLFGG
ncbi:MAG: PBP1A family penicillin-binding protein [Rhizobiales bacterium]|nr:PBP1A family penicillin-binding protein [Hyphomicrobiales bacterium]